MSEPLLSIRDFCVDYITDRGPVRAIDHVSLDVQRGEIVGIAGESGSGKSTLALALMRILPPPAVIAGGSVRFEGQDVLAMSEAELRGLRWTTISMVFQSAMDALNPVITIGEQIADTLEAHGATSAQTTRDRSAELLDMVGISTGRLDAYAHQLSGGMRQRVGIALALALKPSLIILDEPTTALDVIVERDILQQIRELQKKQGFAVLFITHDLARMLQFSHRVAVFYAARLAEMGPAKQLSTQALHPYTQGLLRAFPTVKGGDVELESIPGTPPSLTAPPSGCRFHPRCPVAIKICPQEIPVWQELAPGHSTACHVAAAEANPPLP